MKINPEFRAGYAAIAGLPNAGKSTLLNALVGQKLSIVSPKVQTTRHRIAGFYTDDTMQAVFLDMPGILEPKYGLHGSMMRAVERSINEADCILLLLDPYHLPDSAVMERYFSDKSQIVGVINKTDTAEVEKADAAWAFLAAARIEKTVRISARTGAGIPQLKEHLRSLLPYGIPMYPEDQLSEHPERFFFAEFIREQIFLQTREEVPYSVAVNIQDVNENLKKTEINADIVCERETQKMILIGKGGATLKAIGTEARKTIEEFLGKGVTLKLFVKVRSDWRNSRSFLKSYGYE